MWYAVSSINWSKSTSMLPLARTSAIRTLYTGSGMLAVEADGTTGDGTAGDSDGTTVKADGTDGDADGTAGDSDGTTVKADGTDGDADGTAGDISSSD